MTGFLVVFVLALFVLAFFAYATRRHAAQVRSLEDFRARWQAVDLEAFANLIDPAEERYLREHLAPSVFRRLQRQRLQVAHEYLGRVGQNAQLMVQAGQIVLRLNAGPEAEAFRLRVREATHLRAMVFQAQCALTVQWAVPGFSAPLERVLRVYRDAAQSFDIPHEPGGAVTIH